MPNTAGFLTVVALAVLLVASTIVVADCAARLDQHVEEMM